MFSVKFRLYESSTYKCTEDDSSWSPRKYKALIFN